MSHTDLQPTQFKIQKQSGKNSVAAAHALRAALPKILKQLPNDIEIIEKHHNKKVDAPSGTALMLAREVSNDNTKYVYDRTHYKSQRMKNEIGIHTVRCGGMKGEHEIIFANEYETLVFKHSANSRKLFAHGALEAVRFIVDMVPGMYNVRDLIKSNNLILR